MIRFKYILNILIFSSVMNDHSYADIFKNYQLPENGAPIQNFENATDIRKQKELNEKLKRECPFRKSTSELETIMGEAVTLQLSSRTPDAMVSQCSTQLKYFNESVSKTAELKLKLESGQLDMTLMTPEEQEAIQQEIKTTQLAASSFNNLLQFGCEFKNGSRDIVSYGNQFINILDTVAAIASLNPANILIATSAAISGRLVVSLSRWLFDNPPEGQKLSKEASDSKRFISDLCLFRTLAYKYDDLYIDPFENPQEELGLRLKAKDDATKALKEVRLCYNVTPTDTMTKLTAFSKELAAAVEGTGSQKQCLALINKYKASSAGVNHFKDLATTYGCPNPPAETPETYKAYCKGYGSLETLIADGYYERCEDVDFQKLVTTRFTTLSDIIFHSVQEIVTKTTVVLKPDELQKLRDAEQDERIAIQRYASLQAILEDSPLTHVNASKAMLALGRTVLGDRFDDFSKNTLYATSKNLSESTRGLNSILDLNKRAARTRSEEKKADIQAQICTLVGQSRQQLAVAYQSSLGIKDICHTMKSQGVPPLKPKGLNFDNYSSDHKKKFGKFESHKYLSERCVEIEAEVNENLERIRVQRPRFDSFGC